MTDLLFLQFTNRISKDLDEAYPPNSHNGLTCAEIVHANYGSILIRKWHMFRYFHEDRVSPTFEKGFWIDVSCHPLQDADEPGIFTFTYKDADGEACSEAISHVHLDYDFSNDCIKLTIRMTLPDGTHKTEHVPYPEGRIRMETTVGVE